MNPKIRSRLRLMVEFIAFGAFSGLLYQMVSEYRVDIFAVLIGGFLGLGFWVMEFYILSGLRRHFDKWPLALAIIIKAFIYLTLIVLFLNILSFVFGYLAGKQLEEFFENLFSLDQFILTLYVLVLYIFLSFYHQINLLLGEGVLLKFLMGRYRKPTAEHRIFMFLDLKSSTTIAERLGHVKYYAFLNDFFHEISEPARTTDAEVYQYIGDEVVFTWKTNIGLANFNCLKIFFEIQEKVASKKSYYLEKYGEIPVFKAGLHFGEVISAQIGDIKREIVYNGDVLNTCARIQGECNKYGKELLISGMLLNEFNLGNAFNKEKIDTVTLRGKGTSIELFSLAKI